MGPTYSYEKQQIKLFMKEFPDRQIELKNY